MSAPIPWPSAPAGVTLLAGADRPVRLVLPGAGLMSPAGHPLADLFADGEQRARTSQCYVRSAIGERLRLRATTVHGNAIAVTQADPRTGLEVTVRLDRLGETALSAEAVVSNAGTAPVTLTAMTGFGLLAAGPDREDTAAGLELSWAATGWLAENRWRTAPLRELMPALGLPLHGQDGRSRFAVVSHGAWPTGEHLPMGVLAVAGDGPAIAWELECGGPWLWETGESLHGVHVTGLGPAGNEHGFAHLLAPGARFAGVPAVLAWSARGRDAAVGALTEARRARRRVDLGGLPVVYNDFMNTLMGDPTTKKLLPLIDAAADAGAEVFCVDAGWFAEDGDWWETVGEWREAPHRFTGGLAALTGRIRDRGMIPGLWLEPEVVGVHAPDPGLPEDAWFHRNGARVVEDRRFHLDFRHPAVRQRLDAVVDALVTTFGIGFVKLDYNINPGAGTETAAASPADGLLGHARAYRDWLVDLGRRHPGLIVENCASGAMRADPALLRVTHLQSTSDQQDFRRYPPIAAAAPMSIPPEQAGNWAYPATGMSATETAFAMLAGLTGRLYLSGFLHELAPERRALVAEAVAVHKRWRRAIAASLPSWPLGLPGWADTAVALRLDSPDGALLAVWSRAHGGDVTLPGVTGLTPLYPAHAAPWPSATVPDGLRLTLPGTYDARLFLIADR